MSSDILTAIILSSATLVTVLIKYSLSSKDGRDNLLKDLKIYELLPSGAPCKGVLLKDIEDRIDRRVKEESELTRDLVGTALAMVFILVGIYLISFQEAFKEALSWSTILSATLLLFGAVGFSESFTKAKRNAKGSRIKD